MPEQFGQVAIIMVAVKTSTLLADGGLGVYLVQRTEAVNEYELSRVAILQVLAAVALCVLAAGVSFPVHGWSGSPVPWMVLVAVCSLPLVVMRGMYLLQQEREVRLGPVVRVEVGEELVFAVVAITLALGGHGAWSIAWAQMAKAVVGYIGARLVSETRIRPVGIVWDSKLRQGLMFGLHYQMAQLVDMARVAVNPLFIIPVLGLQAGGFVERSWYLAGAALSIVLAVQKKVMFPYIARVQLDPERIKQAIADAVHTGATLDKLVFLPIVVFAPELIRLVFGPQWLPMVPLLYWLVAGNSLFGALASPLYAAANGVGRSHLVARFNIISFLCSWILIVPLTFIFGISGVGIAGVLLWGLLIYLKRSMTESIGRFGYFHEIVRPVACFLAAGLIGRVVATSWMVGLPPVWLILLGTMASYLVYGALLCVVDQRRLRELVRRFRGGVAMSYGA